VLADFVAQALAEGKSGPDAMRDAVEKTLRDRIVRNARQMEEHYCREASTRRGTDMRSRLDNAIQRAPIRALAERLVRQPPAATAAPSRHDGLDEGVQMP
jgi:hypothetical protein